MLTLTSDLIRRTPLPIKPAYLLRMVRTPFPTLLQVQEFLLESFAGGTEGLMLKRLDAGAAYQPSKRTESWIKIKRCAHPRRVHLPVENAGLSSCAELMYGRISTDCLGRSEGGN